jgi:hypothetical protein
VKAAAFALAASVLLLAVPTAPIGSIGGTTYTYRGTRWGLAAATLTLTRSQVASGHVAVWLGASANTSPVSAWIQAGIVVVQGGSPALYLEYGPQGDLTYTPLGPTSYGAATRVSISDAAGTWTITVDGRVVGRYFLRSGLAVATGESWHDAALNSYSFSIAPLGA